MSFITADDNRVPEPEDPIEAIRWREAHGYRQEDEAVPLLLGEVDRLLGAIGGLAKAVDLYLDGAISANGLRNVVRTIVESAKRGADA